MFSRRCCSSGVRTAADTGIPGAAFPTTARSVGSTFGKNPVILAKQGRSAFAERPCGCVEQAAARSTRSGRRFRGTLIWLFVFYLLRLGAGGYQGLARLVGGILASVTVKSTPNQSGTDLFILHEGRKVIIKDNTMKEWKEIKLEDGNVGWVPTNVIEII